MKVNGGFVLKSRFVVLCVFALIILNGFPVSNSNVVFLKAAWAAEPENGGEKLMKKLWTEMSASTSSEPGNNLEAVKAAIRKSWTDMYESKFTESEPDCVFDYGPKGMRNTYCYAKSVLSYEKLVGLSGIKPFVSGPHTENALNLTSKNDFGRYNIEFVRWLNDNLIPAVEDDKFKWVAEPIYNQYFRGTARIYYITYHMLVSDKPFFENETDKFKTALANDSLDEYWPYQYSDFLDDSVYPRFVDDDFYYGNVTGCAVAFWIRRNADGTHEEFAKGLSRLVSIHDPDFFASWQKMAASNGGKQQGAERVQIASEDRMLLKFLDEFTNAVEKHDWEMVLTFFSPENFRQQQEIGIGKVQYIEEGLGLGMVDNQLVPKPGDETEYSRLNSIDGISITSADPDEDGRITVTGRVVLFDGSTRRVTLYLAKTATGGYTIEPAVG